jgi:hypothetical protein
VKRQKVWAGIDHWWPGARRIASIFQGVSFKPTQAVEGKYKNRSDYKEESTKGSV